MTFATKIQSLVGAHSGIYGPTIDWTRNRVFETGGAWVSRYGLITGLEEVFAGQAALGIPATYGLALNSAGDVISAGPGAAFNGGIQVLSQTDLTSLSAHAFSGGTYGSSFAAVLVGSQKYSVACGPGGAVGGTHNIMICQDTTQVLSEGWPAYATSGSNHNGSLCAGKNGTHKVYLINSPNSGGVTQKVAFTEYTCAAIPTKRTLVEFVPTDIDAAWTEIYFGGACIDQTDGNLLVFLCGQSGATTRNYLLKVSVTNGSVIWKVAAAGTSVRSPGVMQWSSITNSRFGYVSTDSPKTITVVNTTNGSTISTQTTGLHGLTLVIASEAYSDKLGCMVGWYSYNYTDADSPSRLNSTPANFDGLGVLYIADAILPPGPPVPIPGSDMVRPYVPPIIIPPVRQLRLFPRLPINSYRCGADGVSAFPITFRISLQADLRVSVDGVELTQADFTFTGKASSGTWYEGGLLLLDTAAVDCMVRIWADPIPARTTDYSEGEFSKPEANASLEQIWIADRAQHLKQTRDTEIPLTGAVTLPAAMAGLHYRLRGNVVATRAGSDQIYIAATSGTVLTGADENAYCEIVCVKNGLWFVRTKTGSWTLNSVATADYRVTLAGDLRVTLAGDTRELLP